MPRLPPCANAGLADTTRAAPTRSVRARTDTRRFVIAPPWRIALARTSQQEKPLILLRMPGGGAYPFRVFAPAATARLQQQLPNALTLARLIAIPIFAALLLTSDGGRSWAAAIVFGAAGLTDQIDGFLARRWR